MLTADTFNDRLNANTVEEVIMFHEENNQGVNILVSFLIGGIIGAGLALLFAPQSGKKTRRQLSDMADDAAESASVYAKKLKDKIA